MITPQPDSKWMLRADLGDGGHVDTVTSTDGKYVYFDCAHDNMAEVRASLSTWNDYWVEVLPNPPTPAPAPKPTHWRVTATGSRDNTSGTASWTTTEQSQAQMLAEVLSSKGFDTKITALIITEKEVTE